MSEAQLSDLLSEQLSEQNGKYVKVSRIGAAYGIKGWVKLISFTNPKDNILAYRHFLTPRTDILVDLEIDHSRAQGNGFVGHIKDCDDRDLTRAYTGKDLYLEKSRLPELQADEYYWHQLQGLRVLNQAGDDLGVVDHLLETGANDVLVVKADERSIDGEERLIPYIRDRVIISIDLQAGEIRVDWEKDY